MAQWRITCVFGLLAALSFLSLPARAQYQQPQDGHALDANNRVGSAGRNDDPPPVPQVTPNDIFYGNVTAGRAFQGTVQTADPLKFQGFNFSPAYNNFIKNSNGPAQPYTRAPTNYNQPMPFYGTNLATPPPPGFVQQGSTGTYVPALVPTTPLPADSRVQQQPLTLEQYQLPPLGTPGVNGGQVDLAVRPQPLVPLAPDTAIQTTVPPIGLDLDPRLVKEYQAQIHNATTRAYTPQELRQTPPAENTPGPIDRKIELGPINRQVQTPTVSANSQTGESTTVTPRLKAPEKQSETYAKLRNRLDQFYGQKLKEQNPNLNPSPSGPATQPSTMPTSRPQTLEDFGYKDYRQMSRKMMEEAGATSMPAIVAPLPSTLPSVLVATPPANTQLPVTLPSTIAEDHSQQVVLAPQTPAVPPPATAPANANLAPVEVHSLAAGINQPALAQLMQQGEALLKKGDFNGALAAYATAEQNYPNNPLIALARAHVELAGGYFAQADTHLRTALAADTALLMGRYDLGAMIGIDRLTQVVSDLKAQANKSNDPRPLFLLAYIAYNTGSPKIASQYLNLAQQRAGNNDVIIKLIQQHWQLTPQPATQP